MASDKYSASHDHDFLASTAMENRQWRMRLSENRASAPLVGFDPDKQARFTNSNHDPGQIKWKQNVVGDVWKKAAWSVELFQYHSGFGFD